MQLLKFDNITFGYKKDKPIFKNLSFEISIPNDKGCVVALMGSSGSGKSTILKLIMGVEKGYSGRINTNPTDPVISYVPQEPVLFDHLTPLANAEYLAKVGTYKSKFDNHLFSEVSKALQIESILSNSRSVNEISGGQRQRISLLRALSIKPDILLLDEPLTGLDEEVKDQFLQTLATIIDRYKLVVIYVTHHRKEAEFISDVVAYLNNDENGKAAIEVCPARKFFDNPPTVSALNATKEIRVNTMQFELQEGGIIKPLRDSWYLPGPDTFSMSFEDDIIDFSKTEGLEYTKVAETGSYAILKLKESDVPITIELETLGSKYKEGNRLILDGDVNIYNYLGIFLRHAKIKKNILEL